MNTVIIAKSELKTDWYKAYPPNGCCPPSVERRVTEVTIEETDRFYGKLHRYANGREWLEFEDGRTSGIINLWSDGHPDTVNRWLARIQSSPAPGQSAEQYSQETGDKLSTK